MATCRVRPNLPHVGSRSIEPLISCVEDVKAPKIGFSVMMLLLCTCSCFLNIVCVFSVLFLGCCQICLAPVGSFFQKVVCKMTYNV